MKERASWLDSCRALAISLVILNHSVEEIFLFNLYGNQPTSVINSFFMYTCFTLGRIGVPLFLFISGALLLKESYSNEKAKEFYKNNLAALLIATIFWIIIYHVFDIVFYNNPLSVKNLIMEVLLLKQNNMPHMWYMPMIIGIYIAVPFIASIVNSFSERLIAIICLIVMGYTMILPVFVQMLAVLGINKQCSYVVDLNFLGGYYGVYLITGFLIAKHKYNNKRICGIIGSVIFGSAMVIMQVFAFSNGISYRVWYDCIFLYACAIGIMICLHEIDIRNSKLKKAIEYVSKRSLAIYFVHMPLRFMLIKWIPFRSLEGKIATILFWICVYVCSLLVVAIFEKVPFIKKRLFIIK